MRADYLRSRRVARSRKRFAELYAAENGQTAKAEAASRRKLDNARFRRAGALSRTVSKTLLHRTARIDARQFG